MKKTEQEILNYIRGLTLFYHLIGKDREVAYRDILQNINNVLDDYFVNSIKTSEIKDAEKRQFLEEIG